MRKILSDKKMNTLIKKISELKNNKGFSLKVKTRIKEFEALGKKENKFLFQELSFCLMTANFNAEKSIRIQNTINSGFLTLTEKQLEKKLSELGHRFPKTRAHYIVNARQYIPFLENVIDSEDYDARDWLVKNIKGLGLKEASHFLRNCGKKNLAIIDFHIIDLLVKNKIISKPKTLTKSIYLNIEDKLKSIGKLVSLNLAELDLYLWFLETNKLLK